MRIQAQMLVPPIHEKTTIHSRFAFFHLSHEHSDNLIGRMGVSGFTSVLRSQLVASTLFKPQALTEVDDGEALVDGSAFAFHVLDNLGAAARREFGGDYERIAAATEEFVRELLLEGFRVTVIADGRLQHASKAKTRAARERAREDKVFALFHQLSAGVSPEKVSDLPVPMLFLRQVYGTLALMAQRDDRLKVLQAEGEADVLLARKSADFLEMGMDVPVYVFAQDSDFFFTKKVNYCPLETVKVVNGKLQGIVFTREAVAAALQVPQDKMTELAIAIGNDYNPTLVEKAVSLSDHAVAVINKFQSGEYASLDASEDGDEHEGVKFSRLLYENDTSEGGFLSMAQIAELDQVIESAKVVEDETIVLAEHSEEISDEMQEDENNDVGEEEEEEEEIVLRSSSTNEPRVLPPTAPALGLGETPTKSRRLQLKKQVQETVSMVKDGAEKVVSVALEDYFAEVGVGFKPKPDELKNFILDAFEELAQLFQWEVPFLRNNVEYIPQASFWERYLIVFGMQLIISHSMKLLEAEKSHLKLDARYLPAALYDYEQFFPECPRDRVVKGEKELSVGEILQDTPRLEKRHTVSSSGRDAMGGFNLSSANSSGRLQPIVKRGSRMVDAAGKGKWVKPVAMPKTRKKVEEPNSALPIESYRDEILKHIAEHRVTIIHAETGAGKSSMVPKYLIEHNPHARMMISQPRRIAARSLSARVADQIKDGEQRVGLRLGGGLREGARSAAITFCTTGYLVRLLAAKPDYFDRFTHLILDEVHERSVDQDILVLLARRLLEMNSTIRVVLMSATLQAQLFQDYFGCDTPLFVGVKRFPLEIHWAESTSMRAMIGGGERHLLNSLEKQLQKVIESKAPILKGLKGPELNQALAENPSLQMKCSTEVTKLQYRLAVNLVTNLSRESRSAVLIFVGGMTDIQEIISRFESINEQLLMTPALRASYGGVREFRCIAIHGSIPYEEQLEAWSDMSEDVVKVIVATNSAESSITLPDVDNVICLGTKRQLEFDINSGSSSLRDRWVSRASATQRAGRTGRVRPGIVWRLFTEEIYEHMIDFDLPEIHCTPLDKVVLDLKSMISGPVIPLLRQTIDPPSMRRSNEAITSLHDKGLLDNNTDEDSRRTQLGVFVSRISLDLKIGLLIGRGAMLGCLPEAVALASVMSMPQSPFRVATPLIHKDPDEYHAILMGAIGTKSALDGGLLSEPLALVRLLSIWFHMQNTSFRRYFANVGSLAWTRLNRLSIVHKHLIHNVADCTPYSHEDLALPHPTEIFQDPRLLNRMRFILLAMNPGNLVRAAFPEISGQDYTLDVKPLVKEPFAHCAKIELQSNSELTLKDVSSLFPWEQEWLFSKEFKSTASITCEPADCEFTVFCQAMETMAMSLLENPFCLLQDEQKQEQAEKVAAENAVKKGNRTAEVDLAAFLHEKVKQAKMRKTKQKKEKSGTSKPYPGAWVVVVHCKSVEEVREVVGRGRRVRYNSEDDSDSDDSDASNDWYDRLETVQSTQLIEERLFVVMPNQADLIANFSANFPDTADADACERTLDGQQCKVSTVDSGSKAKLNKWRNDMCRTSLAIDAVFSIGMSNRVEVSSSCVELKYDMLEQAIAGVPRGTSKTDIEKIKGRILRVSRIYVGCSSMVKKYVFLKNDNFVKGEGEEEDALSVPPFHDSPLGLRLMMAYASGNRPREVININDAQSGGLKNLVIPGTLPPRFEPFRISVPSSIRADSEGELNIFVQKPKVMKCFAQAHSLESIVRPVEEDCSELFGVAESVTLISKGRAATCTQISLFPSGPDWICRALSCLGSESAQMHIKSAYTRELTRKIAIALWERTTDPEHAVVEDFNLINKIDELFDEFKFCPRPLPPDYYIDLNGASGSTQPETIPADTINGEIKIQKKPAKPKHSNTRPPTKRVETPRKSEDDENGASASPSLVPSVLRRSRLRSNQSMKLLNTVGR